MSFFFKYILFIKRSCITIAFVFFAHATQAQMKLGNKYFAKGMYYEAIQQYKSILHKSPDIAMVFEPLGTAYLNMNQYDSALKYFDKVHHNDRQSNAFLIKYLYALKANGKIDQALSIITNYQKEHRLDSALHSIFEGLVFANKPTSLQWQVVPTHLNSAYREFSPVLFDSNILFVSNEPSHQKRFRNFSYHTNKETNNTSKLNIYKVDTSSLLTTDSFYIYSPSLWFESKNHIGPFTITKQNNIYFTTNNSSFKKVSSLGLRIGKIENGKIVGVKKFNYNNKEYSIEHPSISTSGKYLYFVSDMPGGKGGFDIYMCSLLDSVQQTWSIPTLLNDFVNTPGNEGFPTIVGDTVLYFSSNYLPGYGALDIFKVPLQNGLPIQMPVNLGRGINSTADDFGIVFKKLDKEGYFSSNRNQCNDDIFSFNFIESTVPPSDSIKVDRNVADTSILPVEKATLNYSSDSILSDSVIDKKWVVVYYAFNQSALSKNAKLSLDSLVERIKNHSHVKVILGSFADPVGDPNYNLLLSQKRAQAVLNYLHQKGINKSNIIAQYFGSKYLVSKKPKLAKKNRRTEIMLTYQQNTNWLLLHKSTKPLLINKSKR